MSNENNLICKCNKCNHKWIRRTIEDPKMCPKCKSYNWREVKK